MIRGISAEAVGLKDFLQEIGLLKILANSGVSFRSRQVNQVIGILRVFKGKPMQS